MNRPICQYCQEPILLTDAVALNPPQLSMRHYECDLRSLLGSVAHIEGRCSCYVQGASDTDPEGMTRREAAKAALAAYIKRCKTRPDEH